MKRLLIINITAKNFCLLPFTGYTQISKEAVIIVSSNEKSYGEKSFETCYIGIMLVERYKSKNMLVWQASILHGVCWGGSSTSQPYLQSRYIASNIIAIFTIYDM